MKILHLINSLSGSGGAEQGLVREVLAMRPHADHVVARLYEPDALAPRLISAGIETPLIGVSSSNSGWNWPAAARRFERIAEQYRPDLIQTSLASANLAGQMAGARLGLPVLSTFTLSGDPTLMKAYQPGAAGLPARVLRRVESRWGRRDNVWFRALTEDALVTNCDAGGYDRARAVVIPRGVPAPEPADDVGKEALGLPDVPIILNVGRQTAQKNHGDLIAAFAEIRVHIDAHLVILGREGDGTPGLQRAIAEFGVGEHTTVVDYTDRSYSYYLAADLFLFPSLMEGLGTAVLEAMSCGLPVVAYDIPPIAEIDGGRDLLTLVDVGDTTGLVTEAKAVLADPGQVADRVKRGRQVVADHYSVESVAGRLFEHMESLVDAWARRG